MVNAALMGMPGSDAFDKADLHVLGPCFVHGHAHS